ncbi:MAG TPA: hypothetical protein VE090_02265 [Methylomirabilota bacterium]|nr:hypothetical protein [Methylomirabilota bacterium]
MAKSRLRMKDKQFKAFFKKGGRKDARRIFFELLKRASRQTKT